MKLFSIATIAILVFASPSYQAEDIRKACRAKFKAGPNICQKFGFISSEEVCFFQNK